MVTDSDINTEATLPGGAYTGAISATTTITAQKTNALTPTATNQVTLFDAGNSADGGGNWDNPLLSVYNPAGSQYIPTIGAWKAANSYDDTFGSTGGLWAFIKQPPQGTHGAPANVIYLQGHANGDLILAADSGNPPNLVLTPSTTNVVYNSVIFGQGLFAVSTNSSVSTAVGRIITYAKVATAGMGTAPCYQIGNYITLTTGSTTVLSFSPTGSYGPGGGGFYRLCLTLAVGGTGDTPNVTLTYADVVAGNKSITLQNAALAAHGTFSTVYALYSADSGTIAIAGTSLAGLVIASATLEQIF